MFLRKFRDGFINESDFKVFVIEYFIVKIFFIGEINIKTRDGGKSFGSWPGFRENIAFTQNNQKSYSCEGIILQWILDLRIYEF